MSLVYVIGDLHFGHANITYFRKEFSSEQDHREYIMGKWASVIKKRDLVFVLGDAAFTVDGLMSIGELPGRKKLIRGNHDLLPAQMYLSVFEEMYGAFKYKHAWLTHIPILPRELRGLVNVHGHTHMDSIVKEFPSKYFSTCCEHINYEPIRFEHVMQELLLRTGSGISDDPT